MANERESLPCALPRGTVKSFREYLNGKFKDSARWKHHGYGQRADKYGDYLYRQDRAKFDVELQDALAGHESYKDWKRP